MANPIQAVLDAEARAEEEIANAEKASEKDSFGAHGEARRIVTRNEARTKAAAQRYEARCKSELKAEIENLEQVSEAELQKVLQRIDSEKERIADEVFHEFWPE